MRAELIRAAWGRADHVFQQQFARLLFPGATPSEIEPVAEMQRRSASGAAAARANRARSDIDVTASAGGVRAPTLVMHARDDAMVPIGSGLELASLIPGAEFLALDGRNHLVRADDEGWPVVVERMNAFLCRHAVPPAGSPAGLLTERERDVVRLVAAGLDNEAIAAVLVLSRRTVERHLSNVYAKLRLRGRSARAATAARFAREP